MGSIGSVENMVHRGSPPISEGVQGCYRQAEFIVGERERQPSRLCVSCMFLRAEYLLAGAENGNLKKEAVDAFGKVRGIDPRYELDTRLISPGIIALLTGE